MRVKLPSSAGCFAMVAAMAGLLAGCSTAKVTAPQVPTPREAPINSLALEQCIGQNGAAQCAAGGE